MARKSKETMLAEKNKQEQITTTYRTAAYIRLSTEDFRHKGNVNILRDQEHFVTNYINTKGDLMLCDVFCDNGESGLSFQRPGFEAMIKGVVDGKYNCIVVKDLSRFGRNHLEAAYYIYKFFAKYNTRFIAINDDYDSLYGNNTALEDILLPIKNLINENYAREASRKVGISRRNTIDKGLFISAFAPFGYKKSGTKAGRLEIDEEVAPIVRRVFDMFVIQDMSIVEISRQLNDEGVVSPAQYKIKKGISKNKRWANAVWNTHTVKAILSNPLYVGYLVLGKTRIDMYRNEPLRITKPEERNVVPNAHDSIVSDEIFEMAQMKLEKSKREPITNKMTIPYIFNNLYCGCCGAKLVKQYKKDKTGNVSHIFYACPSDSRGKQTHCSFRKINEDELCEVVYSSLQFYICMAVKNKKIVLNPNSKVLTEYEEDIARCNEIIEDIDTLRSNLFDDFRTGKITSDEYNALTEVYREKQERYQTLLKSLEFDREKYIKDRLERLNWFNKLLQFEKDNHLTKEIVDAFIERINLSGDDQIEICYKFSDVFKDIISNGGVCIG
ncbi:MAG: recombinase family protein [Clostridia bacterium]|nr:recombinase family protein [Clostridia bacterium]